MQSKVATLFPYITMFREKKHNEGEEKKIKFPNLTRL